MGFGGKWDVFEYRIFENGKCDLGNLGFWEKEIRKMRIGKIIFFDI